MPNHRHDPPQKPGGSALQPLYPQKKEVSKCLIFCNIFSPKNQVDTEEVAELARIRKKLKLTQKEAALITGGGHNAFSRYERGEAKPIQAVLNLFRLLDHHPDLLNELRNIRTA